MWQRPLRAGLGLFAVAFGVAVILGVRDRSVPEATVALEGADPDAILQSRGARITLADGSTIDADRQFAYADGRSRLVAVALAVPGDDTRTGLRIRGGEATGSEDEAEWTLTGEVVIETDDGLTGITAEASYADGDGVVRMPAPARFEQGWMTLAGDASRYDRRRGLLHLDREAVVELRSGEGDTAVETRIAAAAALIARTDGYMRFDGEVSINTGDRRMAADQAFVRFDSDASRLDAVELTGDARIEGRDATPGRLRALAAPAIAVTYVDGALHDAAVSDGGLVEIHGEAGAPGAAIAGNSVDVRFDESAGSFAYVRAGGGVTLTLPAAAGTLRIVRADALDLDGAQATSGDDPTTPARFDGAVEYREQGNRGSSERIVRAQRLEATLRDNLTRLSDAQFTGDVRLVAGVVQGLADAATYAPDDETVILLTADADGRPPRVNHRWGSIQAATITVQLDGPDIEAAERVRGVLQLDGDQRDTDDLIRPGLFDEGPPLYATAERFTYDAAAAHSIYTGGARLWQGDTEIRAGTIALHESTGNLEADGDVRTRTAMRRIDHDTGEPVETSAASQGETFRYDHVGREVSYTGDASLASGVTDIAGGTITLHLGDDTRTLERIDANGDIRLTLGDRRAAGDTLAYEDGDGRYDMTGAPVRIVEEMGGGCRETTGRAVTFYVTDEAVTVDGRAEARTTSSTGPCQAF